jgi:Cu(I)/Ag(I) efflux system membrane fusion protein
MWFQFRAYEQDMPWIQIGQKVEITTPSQPGKLFTGEITFIDPNFDDATRSTQVRVELPNPVVKGRREILHKLYADGMVKIENAEVLAVPKSSIIQTGPEAVAYVDEGGGAFARKLLKLGRSGDTLVEVLSGLKAGDKVVTNGNLLIDGQSEMNRSFATPAESVSSPLARLTDPQKKAMGDFLKVADAMAAALSSDNLAAFNKASEPAMKVTSAMLDSLRSHQELASRLDELEKSSHFRGFADLPKARQAFHKFTMATTALLEPLRTAEGMPEFQVWGCYMVDRVIDGAPKDGHWVQTGGRPGHNPFFGRDMLDCVKEIKVGGNKR